MTSGLLAKLTVKRRVPVRAGNPRAKRLSKRLPRLLEIEGHLQGARQLALHREHLTSSRCFGVQLRPVSTRAPNHCLRDLSHNRSRAAGHPNEGPQPHHGNRRLPGPSVRSCLTESHVPVHRRCRPRRRKVLQQKTRRSVRRSRFSFSSSGSYLPPLEHADRTLLPVWARRLPWHALSRARESGIKTRIYAL